MPHPRREVLDGYVVVITPSTAGGYVAEVPALPGCFTQGDTLEQVRERVREAIAVTLDDLAWVHGGAPWG